MNARSADEPETQTPVPRDLPDQQADGAEEETPDLEETDDGPFPDTDEAGTGPRGTPGTGTDDEEDTDRPPPMEPTD